MHGHLAAVEDWCVDHVARQVETWGLAKCRSEERRMVEEGAERPTDVSQLPQIVIWQEEEDVKENFGRKSGQSGMDGRGFRRDERRRYRHVRSDS